MYFFANYIYLFCIFSLDVDEVAAAHVNCDLIIHYGKTAFTSTSNTDTIYVFGKNVVEVDEIVKRYDEKYNKDSKTLVLLDVDCYHIAGKFSK